MDSGNLVRTDNRGKTARTYTYLSAFGTETYQILLQEEAGAWIARIVTLPNKLWANPNGREALKFVAPTADEAERLAVDTMEAECVRTGKRPVSESVLIQGGSGVDYGDQTGAVKRSDSAVRRCQRLLVRFGETTPEFPAITGNFSETGLFIISDQPARPGSRLRIDLRCPEGPIELSGEVVWTRPEKQEGLSVGFAVRLTDRPRRYVDWVRSLG